MKAHEVAPYFQERILLEDAPILFFLTERAIRAVIRDIDLSRQRVRFAELLATTVAPISTGAHH